MANSGWRNCIRCGIIKVTKIVLVRPSRSDAAGLFVGPNEMVGHDDPDNIPSVQQECCGMYHKYQAPFNVGTIVLDFVIHL